MGTGNVRFCPGRHSVCLLKPCCPKANHSVMSSFCCKPEINYMMQTIGNKLSYVLIYETMLNIILLMDHLLSCTDNVSFFLEQASTSKSSSRTALRKHVNGNGSKHSSVTKKNLSQEKASSGKRLHPGLISSQDRSTAHYGAVIGLKMTSDGLYLLSAG